MISKETIISLLTNAKETKGKEIISNCPFCNKEQHFFINKYSFLFSCKKCGKDGNLKILLQHLGKLYLLEGDSISVTLKKLETNENQEQIDIDLPTQKLPIGFKELTYNSNNRFAKYLKQRKFNKIDFELYQPGYTELVGRYENYVLLPIYRDLVVKGLVGRYAINSNEPDFNPDKRRYENSKGTNFAKLLFGVDELTQLTQTVIVVEGPFDKISATTELDLHKQDEIKCVCTFGKKISDGQLKLISNYKNIKTLIFMYDVYDAINDMKKAGLEALNYIPNVLACRHITAKDPGDMNQQELLIMLDSAEKIQNFVYNRVKLNPVK